MGLSRITTSSITDGNISVTDFANTGDVRIYSPSANTLVAYTTATERLRIDASGNVGIGTSTPDAKLTVSTIASFGNGSNGAPSIAHTGDLNTGFYFPSADTIGLVTNGIERMRLDSSGNFTITGSSTDVTGSAYLHVYGNGNTRIPAIFQDTMIDNSYQWIQFRYGSDNSLSNGGIPGSITGSNTSVSYNTSSDYRLKDNIQPMTGALAKIAQLNPVTFTWKVDGSAGQGFIAHELQAVVPDCVTGEKDAVDKDGKPQYQGVDTSFLVATLTKAIQEQHTLITTMQTTITDLTARVQTLESK